MVLSVIENAYLRKAEEISSFNETHKKLLLFLLHEKKHYTKAELSCFANYCESRLDKVLKDLERASLIKISGWLISLEEEGVMTQALVSELKNEKPKEINNKLKTLNYSSETIIFNKKRKNNSFY
ncbi:MAG TPA: hypothetical protein PKK60_02080 [archaeon]|nr:hypothetical protein [archaeon]